MDKTVVIDAGHGLYTKGKRCLKSLDPAETREWILNDRIADKVIAKLEAYNCNPLRSDDTTGVVDVSLSKRCAFANNQKAILFVSLHHNAGIKGGVGGGTITYCGSIRNVDKAQAITDKIKKHTGLQGNRSVEAMYKGFYVLTKTKMESYLIEVGFMDSSVDIKYILEESFAEKVAEAVVSKIVDFLELELDITEQPKPSKGVMYFPKYKHTNTLVGALKELGIDSSYSHRAKIAHMNNIKGYTGTAVQNTQMYNLLKAGLLIRG